jgi:hypothetical protein
MPRTPQIPPLAGMTPLGVRSNVVPFPGVTRSLHVDQTEIAKRKTSAPLKPKTPQKPCDFGLFSDDAKQSDLVDLARRDRS